MKKFISLLMSLFIVASALPCTAEGEALSEDIVILYTNDVHTYIDGALSYDTVAAIKKDLQKQYKYVYLADAGDHIQGTAYGSMDKGASIIKMMNSAKYDVATLGNHEFDYGMDGCLNTIAAADFPYVSANFYREKNGMRTENVLDSFVMFDCGNEKLAVIGITTPDTFTKSTPAYFQDENGNFIYGISAGSDGGALQSDVQKAIEEAKAEGATRIVALGHLGIDPSSAPWTSRETIANVSGLDAFIDGHSHSIVESETVKDKDGNDVLLTQTGNYFDRIGIMVIDSDTDEITTDFIECEEISADDGETVDGYKLVSDIYDGEALVSDGDVKPIKDDWISETENKLGEKIGTVKVKLDNYDADGNRLVRSEETNSGDFAADALYYLFDEMDMDVDIAVANGGGIRNYAVTGDISYKICKDLHPFGNVACLQTVSGKQILDALEWGARETGLCENGGFLQVSGITYKIDTSIPNTVKSNEIGTWTAGPDKYRVYDVKVYDKAANAYVPLDLDASYNLAGYNYTLRNLGDGYAMFSGAINVLDYVMEDYMVIANYVQGFDGRVVDAKNSPLKEKYPGLLVDYGTVNGSGRIEISSGEEDFDDVVIVGGVQITTDNKDDVFGDGGSVKYDSKTDTLTLTDATITNESGHGIYSYGVNLTIKGIDTEKDGNNTIIGVSTEEKGTDEDGKETTVLLPGCGIYVEDDGFGESGNLVIEGSIGDIVADKGNGISASNNIVVRGKINAIKGYDGINDGIESQFGDIVVEKNGKIGDIITDGNGISSYGDTVLDGKIGNIVGGGYAGVYAMNGDITIGGSVESITGDASGIEAYDGFEENCGGNISIRGTVGKVSGGYVGICAAYDFAVSGSAEVYATDEEEGVAVLCGGDIIVADAENGVIEPKEYEIITLPATVGEAELYNVSYTTISADGQTAAKTVKFKGFVNPFADVDENAWYYENVKYAVTNGLIKGTSENTFDPNGSLTRAMLVTIIYRAEGEPAVNRSIPFADVLGGSFYANAVLWAQQNDIVSGVGENRFAPDENITREQIAAIIYRFAQYKGYDVSVGEDTDVRSYADSKEVSDFATEAIGYAVDSGIMKGKTKNTLNPKDNAIRAEFAAVLQRFIESN